MDIITKLLKSKGFSVVASDKLKEGNKKPVDASQVYIANRDFLKSHGIILDEFEEAISQIYQSRLEHKAAVNEEDEHAEFIAQCDFVFQKFRWYITDERDVIFYEKTRPDAMEFKYLTTERLSDKFYNCLTKDEKLRLEEIVKTYNSSSEKKKFKTILDCFPVLITHLYTHPEYQFEIEPKTLSNDKDVPCFKFYDIKLLEEKGLAYEKKHGHRRPTPAWDAFFARIVDQSMVPVVKAFLAGLFMDNNTSKQVLYIQGEGNDGKTQIAKALLQEMGKRVSFTLPQNMKLNQFGSYDAYGKRLFIGEELHSPNVFKTNILHALTGGSPVRVERKGEQAFYTELYACGIITSNYKPEIENVENQTSRLIYVEMRRADAAERARGGNAWSQAIRDEVRSMIYDGIKYFRELNPGGSVYSLPNEHSEAVELLFDDKTAHIQQFIDQAFEFDESSFVRQRLGEAFRAYCLSEIFKTDEDMAKEYKDNRTTHLIFAAMKERWPDVRQASKKLDGLKIKVIIGLKLKPSPSLNYLKQHLDPPKEKTFKLAAVD